MSTPWFVHATNNFSGLVTGPILRRFSYRKVAIAGGLLTALGMMLTSGATVMWHMIITYSLLVGLGLGLLAPSTFVVVNSYFTTARGRAVGLSLAGTGVGQMLMPHAVRALLDEYNFRGTVLLLGAVALHALPGAALFHPVKWHRRRSPPEEQPLPLEKKDKTPSRNASAASLRGMDMGVVVVIPDPNREDDKDAGDASCWERAVKIFDLDLLRDPVFVNLVVGLAAVFAAGVNFAMVFPFFLSSVGLTRSETALCMSLLAGGDIVCRLLLPQVTDKVKISSKLTFMVGALGLAAVRSWLAMQTELSWLMAVSMLCGFVRGATVVNLNLSISESCDEEKLPAALGINMVLKGMAILLVGPLFGWIRDQTGSFPLCIHMLSLLMVVPMAAWLLEMIFSRRRGS